MRLKKHVFCHLSYLIHQFFIPASPASQSQIDSQSTSSEVPGLRANVSTTSPQVVWNCANNSCNISNSRLMSVSKSGREMQRRLLSNWPGILGVLLLRIPWIQFKKGSLRQSGDPTNPPKSKPELRS
jgi:hypothetical protein